jgi:hypothetical protein
MPQPLQYPSSSPLPHSVRLSRANDALYQWVFLVPPNSSPSTTLDPVILTERRRLPRMLPGLRSEHLITQLVETARTPDRGRNSILLARHFLFLIPLYLVSGELCEDHQRR